MSLRRSIAVAVSVAGTLVILLHGGTAARAAAVTSDEIAKLCANAESTAQCGRVIEEYQLKRLPMLAVRDGAALKVSLYPAGAATFTDTEAPNGGRSYSL